MRFSLLLLHFFAAFIITVIGQECIPDNQRIDCHPDPNPSEERCVNRGCSWCPGAAPGVPLCITKPEYGYNMESLLPEENGYRVLLSRASVDSSYFGEDFDLLTANVMFESDYRLRIRIAPADIERYEVPLQVNPPSSPPSVNALYSVEFANSPAFSFQVKRRSSGAILFDTSLGGLTFSNQFIQIATKLPSENVYGIGENEQHTFRLNFSSFVSYPLYARDSAPSGTTNLYGVQPYYTVVENDGKTHSVMIVNSNAQEFVVHPAPGFVYRTIGGIIDIYIFLGPTPEETAQQFTEAVGRAPIPPYWALGFQLCRYGYDSIENMKAAVDRTAMYGIPHDVQYGDIDIMDRRLDFTYNNVTFHGLPEYIAELRESGIKFVTILDPAISSTEPNYRPLELGNELDVWVKRPDGTPFLGRVWPDGPTYFPDYSKNSTRTWWITLIVEFHDLLAYDGIWIDMNEPANFAFGDVEQGCAEDDTHNFPPYIPPIKGNALPDFTVCPDAHQEFGLHYNTHSLYGWSESEPTLAGVRAALGKRSFVFSRSTFLGIGKWASHWLGDNFSRWTDLRYSIIGTLQFNHFGIPYVGPDICGHNNDVEEELCTRWHQLGITICYHKRISSEVPFNMKNSYEHGTLASRLEFSGYHLALSQKAGAFYPYSRNHNGNGYVAQDPGVWGPASANSTRDALLVRYTLLPYLYTLFYQHVKYGNTVARALWHSFPADAIALGVDRQLLWGDGVLISPVLEEGATTVDAYFPNSRWYSYYTGLEISNPGSFQTLDAPFNFIPVHIHGGKVIPTQEPAVNTELSKLNPFGLIVALDGNFRAEGNLYVDDGDSIDPEITGNYFEVNYIANAQQLRNVKIHQGYNVSAKVLDTIRILGHGRSVSTVIVNGNAHTDYSYNPITGELLIRRVNAALDADLTVSWI